MLATTSLLGAPDMTTLSRSRLHQLVDELPEEEIPAAEHCLKALCEHDDPVLRTLRSAPVDDEPLTEQERKEIEEAQRDLDAGHRVSDAQIRANLGL